MNTYEELFLNTCREKLKIAQSLRQINNVGIADIQTFFSKEYDAYDSSFLNPSYLQRIGICEPGLMSTIYQMYLQSIALAILNRPIFVWEKSMLLKKIEDFFQDKDLDALYQSIAEINLSIMEMRLEQEASESVDPNNLFKDILLASNAENLNWMARYAKPISDFDQKLVQHWFSLDKKKLEHIANHIVDAFFHGFISQSRSIQGRTNIRMHYCIGQEALAKEVYLAFINKGYEPILLEPASNSYPDAYSIDHSFDTMFQLYVSDNEKLKAFFEQSAQKYQDQAKNTCGFVRISSFGKTPNVQRSPHAFTPPKELKAQYLDYVSHARDIESQILKPDHLSFCSVAFPDFHVGENFPEIFTKFITINTRESAPFEKIQQDFIDILDTADSVHILGAGQNQTDIRIALQALADSDTQSNFLNCGGDLNIPHGEIFTTPQLSGTNGVYYINEIFIKGNYYKNLYLKFEDGRVSDYHCANFTDDGDNRKYVLEHLLQGHDSIAMGEFAIGTNTEVYQIAKKHNIFAKLPILIAEKMGPHIAIGDPCFARGEDSPVYNLWNSKEMTARANEITCNRLLNKHCYFNMHTDITLPYDEIQELSAYKNGKLICTFIKDGKFVPDFAAALNANITE